MIITLLAIAALFLAFSNGANDNFKGFATVWGSATLNYRKALIIATLAAVAGSLLSIWLADGLVKQFSGKGLVPDEVSTLPSFALAVAVGASATVMLATRIGLPISTTHSLVGGLVGAGLASSAAGVDFAKLGTAFMLPLLFSPIFSALLSFGIFKFLPKRNKAKDCICLVQPDGKVMRDGTAAQSVGMPEVAVTTNDDCPIHGTIIARGSVSGVLDKAHIISATTICFARSVNDTPKLAALLVAAQLGHPNVSLLAIAIAIAAGGLILSRRVANTMSQKLTALDPAQGIPANIITAFIVLFASRLGLPVSTTHVTVGAISGVGASAGTLRIPMLRTILLSWVATLPMAAVIAWTVAKLSA